MSTSYLSGVSTRATPQSEPILGSDQSPNNAGGYGWDVDDWQRLERFLVLGSEGGAYYAGQRKLTRENAEATLRCIKEDGPRVVRRIVEISDGGRAAKNDPALFALALAASFGGYETRSQAFAALPKVARIGTHLFMFVEFCDGLRGWGRGLRRAIVDWYDEKTPANLAYQLVKYQQRGGWSHRDLFRLAHPKPYGEPSTAICHWVVKGWPEVGDEPHPDPVLRRIWAFEQLKRTTSIERVCDLIRDYDLPREAVPTEHLKDAAVWATLLERMPLTALTRNLATMTRVGLLQPMNDATQQVVARLHDERAIANARLHPIQVLAALKTYAQGHGERSSQTWTPVGSIVDALNDAFYLSFGNGRPTDKRILFGLDVSGSMAGTMVNGIPGLEARVACGAMALVSATWEKQYAFVAFDTQPYGVAITPKQRLDDVVKLLAATGGGGTDCALPIKVAHDGDLPVDAFVILTDSETWHGHMHAKQALDAYRKKSGIPAKLVVVAMASNQTSIADPGDRGMLNVVGFDTATPQLIHDFIAG